MESKVRISAETSTWRCSYAASSGSRQMEKLPAASMERTMKSMKSQLFKMKDYEANRQRLRIPMRVDRM
ncbi:hypothetical protein Tcan_08632 [Toxocara canis]|uniref:Uncharacterized protein n=1 Tax=Toxocara canis TaxID=6265 RepID=A0A0B2W366_TOXCA|nr:hypothetical protein Tcan_08632 [Toxocara canis]